ncbi:MAG TPA: response regulator transcription factor [Nitrospirales bacterium]|nr:response regulator transcription factor [Nitrospirales bacterium]
MNAIKRARIFLVDDHVLVLESCKKLLEPHHDIVGEAHGASDLVSQIRQSKPDILLMDISMPDQNGYDAARLLKAAYPSLKIIFVSMHLEPTFIMEAFRSGGEGYVPKQTAGSELLSAIQQVQEKQRYLSPLISEEVQNAVLAQMDGIPGTELSGKLTPRQQEVLKLVAQGFSAKDIANMLTISQSTVAFHKMQIVQALGLHSKADLTKYAIKLGISPLE